MNAFLQDIRYALRMLAKSPGIHGHRDPNVGAGNRREHRLFSVVNSVLLNPL